MITTPHEGHLAAPEDVLRGTPLGPATDTAYCVCCRAVLQSGAPVTVYAYRLADSPYWDVPRLFCRECAPDELTPTLGAHDVLADATLGTQSRPDLQSHRLCLVEPTVTAYAGPSTGATP